MVPPQIRKIHKEITTITTGDNVEKPSHITLLVGQTVGPPKENTWQYFKNYKLGTQSGYL